MVTEDSDDGEGELLDRIRTIAPRLPIAVALDFHANVSARMVANATIITGYRTYPHTDVVETGYRAGRLLLATIAERIVPTMEREICPVLPNILCQTTDSPPMSELMAAAREAEAGEALAVSVFAGFPLADAADTGFSAVVVIDNDRSKARRIGCRVSDSATWVLGGCKLASFRGRFCLRKIKVLRVDRRRNPLLIHKRSRRGRHSFGSFPRSHCNATWQCDVTAWRCGDAWPIRP